MKKLYVFPAILVVLLLFAAVGCGNVTTHEDGTASVQQLDTAKATAIRARFAQDKVLAGQQIKITVINNEVTLEGTVPTEDAKGTAENLSITEPGIVRVHNKLVVKPEETK